MTSSTERQLTLPILADLMPRGDGSYVLRPRLPAAGETWLTTRQAAAILGVSIASIYRLADEGRIRHRRTRPGKREYDLGSVTQFAAQAEDPEYWR